MRGTFSKLTAGLATPARSAVIALQLFAAAALILLTLSHATASRADGVEILEARLEQTDDGVVLQAEFAFDFNARLEQVVANGVPLYFVTEFVLTRPRWYWFDEKTVAKRRQTRLSYHALSRHYRLSSGLLQQNFATLGEALAVLRRLRNWQVIERGVPLADGEYQAEVRMRLDLTLLPKPFQLNALTNREWHLESDWKRFGWRPAAAPALEAPVGTQPADRRDEGASK